MAKNKLTPFEQMMKESLENLPVDGSTSDWSDINQRLNQVQLPAKTVGRTFKLLMGIAVLSGIASLVFIPHWNNNTPEQQVAVTAVPDEDQNAQEAANQTDADNAKIQNKENITQLNGAVEPETVNKLDISEISDENTTAVPSNSQTDGAGLNETELENVSSDELPLSNQLERAAANTSEEISSNENTESGEKLFRKPVIRLSSEDVCVGDICKARLSSHKENWTVSWYLSDGRMLEGASIEFTGDAATRLSLYAQIQAEKMTVRTEDVSLEIHRVPTAKFTSVKENLSNDLIPFVLFKAVPSDIDGLEFNWNFGNSNNNTAIGAEVKHYYTSKGMYVVTLQAKSQHGCTAIHKEVVAVNDNFNLLAPTSFSPNDDGLNDTWLPATLKHSEYEFSLEIMDKNSDVVFRTSDANEPWDGEVNGKSAERGDFFFWRAFVNHKNEDLVNEYGGRITITK